MKFGDNKEKRQKREKVNAKFISLFFYTQTDKEGLNKQLFNQAAAIETDKLFTNVIGTTDATKEKKRYSKP